MKKITAFVGTGRKKSTYYAVRRFLDNVESQGEVACEIVHLNDFQLGICKGCKACFTKGPEFCPLKDDRDVLIEKMMASDGVVFATPNYSFQVSAITKLFLDRLGYVFHRPQFFGKTFTSIVVQGIYGGADIVRYLDFAGRGLGFQVVKGSHVTALEPMTQREKRNIDDALASHSTRFYRGLMKPTHPVPGFVQLVGFRMSRTSMRVQLDERSRDFTHYRDMGWFESDYYYPTHLGALKKLVGALFDQIAAMMARSRESSPSQDDRCGAQPSSSASPMRRPSGPRM
jgi:multimeric flavodoxin WrbA